MGFLYLLEFAGGKRYIGITERETLSERISRHRDFVKRGGDYAVQRAWRKHGEPSVKTLAIASGPYLLDLERRAIASYDTFGPRGYNMTPGGESPPAKVPEIAAKISRALTGRKLSAERVQAMRLFRPSDETRRKMAAAKVGRAVPPEVRAKMSLSHRARPMTEERRRQLDAARAKNWTPEKRAALAAKNRTRVWTPEMRAKMSASKRAAAL